MWIYILLYILVLNTSQATGKDNSTQMYYVKLMIEESAIGNITEILKPFVRDTNLHVDNLEKTTVCQNVTGGRECTCEPNYKWGNEVCKLKENCCSNKTCTFSDKSSHMCVSSASVTVTGSIALKGQNFVGCLEEKTSHYFKNCNDNLLKNMKNVYSTLRGFDTLTIRKYRFGSIIGEFELTIAQDISMQKLNNKTKDLIKALNASFVLETSGVVHLSMPPNPVCYNDTHKLTCTAKENLGVNPEWHLKREDHVFKITNGTESTVTRGGLQTTVELKTISELWAGEYSCIYKQDAKSLTISHKASAILDVSLLPNIYISITPSFPQCKHKDLVAVKFQCEIESNSENYTVTWRKTDITGKLEPQQLTSSSGASGETHISCGSSSIPQLTCTYTNRCNQKRSASITVHIIHENDPFCSAEGDWEATKGGHTAVLKCKNKAGRRQRKCTGKTWEPEVISCVNRKVKDVLEKANIVDIGRGSLDENAARVFSLLQNVTNKTETINSFPDINASVETLYVLSQKELLVPKDASADDLLESSSNLLEKPLAQSWETSDNTVLAEKYLTAVEQLIYKSNLNGTSSKKYKNIEVAGQICSQGTKCSNTVFNVSIDLQSSDPGSVKMVGFQELDKLLAKKDDDFKPNSIVVSTTTEKKQHEKLKVTLDFKLLTSRRRNVEIRCVSWDNNTSSWSTYGCKWGGPANEEQCICSHLSSFAVLMSKYPLEVPWLTTITYIGLSVSVVSLIITLAIEVAVWSAVVRTNSLYLRHTAHINICLCLLVADCSFLASSKPEALSQIWCKTFVVLKHFCYLSMFFWMLCLSVTLLHQAVFLFHAVSKKTYLKFSVVLGYVCPFLIVSITVLTSVSTSTSTSAGADADAGAVVENWYNNETCWLVYNGLMKGTIHAFVIPVGIIVIVNIFSMLVVIMKLLDHPKNADMSHDKDKKAALTVMRTVVLLTPVFGVTWIFGFAVMVLDLTNGILVYLIHYAFTLLNAFQGLFILLTTCLGDKPTRDALMKRLKHRAPTSTTDSTTKLDSTSKK